MLRGMHSADRDDGELQVGARRQPLLGALASRAGLGETFATEALGVLNQDRTIRQSFLGFLEQAVGADLSHVKRISTEVDHRRYGRTDIEGQDTVGRPALIVEAKFGASLTVEQVARYLELQSVECGAARPALVLLMPRSRTEDAAHLLRQAEAHAGASRSATACISWSDMLDTLQSALGDAECGSNSLEADVIQLRALVEARTSFVLGPLGVAAAGTQWMTRRAELVGLVDVVTQRLADSLGVARGPQIGRRDIAFAPAYYLKLDVPVPETHAAVGLHAGFAAHGSTPMWVRFHRVTGGGLAVKQLRLSFGQDIHYASRVRLDGGHLWVPVELDRSLSDDDLVDAVVRQVDAIFLAAHPHPLPPIR